MSSILLGLWLILFGIMALLSTKVPDWVVPLAAIGVGFFVALSGYRAKPPG